MSLIKFVVASLSVLSQNQYSLFRKYGLKYNRSYLVGRSELYRYFKGRLQLNKDISNVVCQITKGYYDYQYFNVCFLNNIFSFILMCIAENKIPQICIKNDNGENIWEWFFEQPFSDLYTNEKIIEKYDAQYLEVFPDFSDVYDQDMTKWWSALYHDYWKLNDTTKDYVEQEVKNIIGNRRVLGVICRGTDYTDCKPKGHPVQPDIKDVIELVSQQFAKLNFDYIYLATEDGRIDKEFKDVFGDKVLINKRTYYDSCFKEKQLTWIKDVHFERENDDYYKGLEYISSLVILSECNALIGGNCGGCQTAIFLNRNRYEYKYIFDLGIY